MRRLRARRVAERAAALAPADGPSLLAPEDRLLPAVEVTVKALGLGERDAGLVQLARRLAAEIDEAADPVVALRVHGPALLRVLKSMGATPASRAREKPKQPKGPPSAMSKLRAAHAETVARRLRSAPEVARPIRETPAR